LSCVGDVIVTALPDNADVDDYGVVVESGN
jgi:hypothetical protein